MPEVALDSNLQSAVVEKTATPPEMTGGVIPVEKIKTLLEWDSLSRLFIPRDKKYFSNLGILILIAGLVLIFFKEFVIILVVLALAFVTYALSTVPPEKIHHKITSQGVVSADHSYGWKELKDFWFTEKDGITILQINTVLRFPARLIILVDRPATKEKITANLSPFLHFNETHQEHWLDKVSSTLAEKLNSR